GADPTPDAGRARATRAIESGAAWIRFVEMVTAQGGDAKRVEQGLEAAPVVLEARADRAGTLSGIDTRGLGELVIAIGGRRRGEEDTVDPRVGLMVRRRLGERIAAGDLLAEVHLAKSDPGAVQRVQACFTIAD